MPHFTAAARTGPPACPRPALLPACQSGHLPNTLFSWKLLKMHVARLEQTTIWPPAVSCASRMDTNFCVQTSQNLSGTKLKGVTSNHDITAVVYALLD